jgi:hypothetical protein
LIEDKCRLLVARLKKSPYTFEIAGNTKAKGCNMSGRGTAAGIEFQGTVGAVFASFMLSDKSSSILNPSLLGKPTKIQFEVPTSVDDIKIQTVDGQLLIQAKNSIAMSEVGKGDMYSAIQQFVQQYIDGVVDDGVRRDLDKVHDRLILAVPEKAPDTVKSVLKAVLDRVRTEAATGLSEDMKSKLSTFENHIRKAWCAIKDSEISSADLEKIIGLSSVVTIGTAEVGNAKLALGSIIAKSGEEDALFQQLQTWAVSASAAGTGR